MTARVVFCIEHNTSCRMTTCHDCKMEEHVSSFWLVLPPFLMGEPQRVCKRCATERLIDTSGGV